MILALDTSTARLSLALHDGTQILAAKHWQGRLRHTQTLAPAVQELLELTQTQIQSLSAVAVALGPGSFTSLRVGLSFAKGLALSRRLPLLGVPTLDILAAAVPPTEGQELLAVLQAGRGRLALVRYACPDGNWQAQTEPASTSLDNLLSSIAAPTVLCGELTAEERQRAAKHRLVTVPPPARCLRRAGWLAELAWQRLHDGTQDDPATLAPIYLHTSGAPI